MTRWQLVPVEADLNMQDKATTIVVEDGRGGTTALNWPEAASVYTAMLSAAPAPDDDAVIETAARALDKLDQDECGLGAWDDHKQQVRVYRMQQARAAIDALLGEQG